MVFQKEEERMRDWFRHRLNLESAHDALVQKPELDGGLYRRSVMLEGARSPEDRRDGAIL
jgi:hypothetical protein